ncbi:ABC transporter ATP-binding protein [Pricia sp. S334]|uniref:ABC transporter ATP-binding protein n=1 Tax=Pricia mediterranea TaxID=3076079 RepID=A0ABU3L958_9FLAO|nr:ABC transporter ATP-binding protein [Pricia sp. S334]MDT7830275.1 ABC transporter ATP-binding protein [Pricia sp. S334]
MTKSQPPTLSVSNLSIGYTSAVIAENIDFSLSEGELAAIVGINGIGKSTLLRTLGHVQPALGGKILIAGKPLKEYSHVQLASRVSLVLTEPVASKNMTVLELIALGRQPYTNWLGRLSAADRTKVGEAIGMLELEALQHRKCFELSDGQLQRVLIARALAQDTAIILLDEPTTHLDLYHKVQILKLLKSIADQTGKSILFTSHEIEMAIQLCDKMLLVNGTDNPFGQPCKLIEQRAFHDLFPADTVSFDASTGAFRIKK